MKKFKKIFAVLLTLAMVLGMSMTSFAAEKTTVTVKGLAEGVKVSYVKIAERKEDGSGWKLVDGINVGMSIDDIIKAGNADSAATGVINTNLSNLELSGLTYGSTKVANKVDTDYQVEFENMEAGLYAIKAEDENNVYVYSDMVAFVGYEDGQIKAATVTAKGRSNQVEKEIVNKDDATVAAGDEVEYKVTVKYPFFVSNASTNSFVISDKVENGTFKAGSVEIPDGFGLTANNYGGSDTLTITLTGNYDSTKAGQDIEIKYTVVAGNNVTSTNPLKNAAKSEVNVNGETTSTQYVVETPSVDVSITKTDENGDTITGSTASFALYETVEPGTSGAVQIDVKGGTKVWAKQVATANTENGVATFSGLAADNTRYYVKETQAPEGYALEPLAYPLTGSTINDGTETSATTAGVKTVTTTYTATGFTSVNMLEESDSLNFVNSGLSALPSTGGIGTTIFTIGGCAIMIIAAALFFASRRKAAK